jgi:hypothetical protein
MAPLDGKAPPMNKFRHQSMIPKSGYRFSEKIMPTINWSKTTPQPTAISLQSNHRRAAPVRSTEPEAPIPP